MLDPCATPLLARRTQAAGSLDELLFAMIVLGDDRLVERARIAGTQGAVPTIEDLNQAPARAPP